jgi:hypothetical protein
VNGAAAFEVLEVQRNWRQSRDLVTVQFSTLWLLALSKTEIDHEGKAFCVYTRDWSDHDNAPKRTNERWSSELFQEVAGTLEQVCGKPRRLIDICILDNNFLLILTFTISFWSHLVHYSVKIYGGSWFIIRWSCDQSLQGRSLRSWRWRWYFFLKHW